MTGMPEMNKGYKNELDFICKSHFGGMENHSIRNKLKITKL